ncbi:MAG: beta-L-arabinofuranosidase domain-containing protein [Puniceicoccaceae bacterium]
MKIHPFHYMMLCLACVFTLNGQAIQSHSAKTDPGPQQLTIRPSLPQPELHLPAPETVRLLPGLFQERRNLNKQYLQRLSTRNLLQNHLLEAGVRIDDASEQLHQGWESPHYQLRGHFAGHWLSSAARIAAADSDDILRARVAEVVRSLNHCQSLNGGQWVGSIPEKYFHMLESGQPVWSPQYTLHKTLMGLLDSHRYLQTPQALETLKNGANWFINWSDGLIQRGRGEVVYSGECAGMLELWVDLYVQTGDSRYLALASRYAMPDLFASLLDGIDSLSNDHTNASIPWIHGAARLYEITGDATYRQIVETFWEKAVVHRGMFATTGNNAGEFWIPPQQFARFLGSRTQEHCTVYNMIRVASYLLNWTGESQYADYIERAIYNGILAQQHPTTGMVAYFLPTEPGAHKEWGSETHDFWCCHGTLVQAHAMTESWIWGVAANGLALHQFIPSHAILEVNGQSVELEVSLDPSADQSNFVQPDSTSRWVVRVAIRTSSQQPWTLSIRQPEWAIEPGRIEIDGVHQPTLQTSRGYLEVEIHPDTQFVQVSFPKELRRESLPGDQKRFALLDGPIVLAALSKTEPILETNFTEVTPQYEHLYVSGRDWECGHYLLQTSSGTLPLIPLYEVTDETYSVYMRQSHRE